MEPIVVIIWDPDEFAQILVWPYESYCCLFQSMWGSDNGPGPGLSPLQQLLQEQKKNQKQDLTWAHNLPASLERYCGRQGNGNMITYCSRALMLWDLPSVFAADGTESLLGSCLAHLLPTVKIVLGSSWVWHAPSGFGCALCVAAIFGEIWQAGVWRHQLAFSRT